MRKEDAFTGLEAAVVLIAFIVVAAVFSYVVLGAGFFATQKSQEVVHKGVAQTSSSVEVVGDVMGMANVADKRLESVLFTVKLSPGSDAIDFDKVVILYSDANNIKTLARKAESGSTTTNVGAGSGYASCGEWYIYERLNSNDNLLLEPFEQYTLTVGIPDDIHVRLDHLFTVEIRPMGGQSYAITRITPSRFTAVNILRW